MTCPLCEAANEEYRILSKDDLVFVILNRVQAREFQVLVLPVRHVERIGDLTPEESYAFNQAIHRFMEFFDREYEFDIESPLCILQGWKHRSQPHVHSHIIPSTRNWYQLMFLERLGNPKHQDEETLTAIAHSLRSFMTPEEQGKSATD